MAPQRHDEDGSRALHQLLHPRYQVGVAELLVERHQHVRGILAAAIQNDLHVVRHGEARGTRLVAVDQRRGADLLGERLGIVRPVVAPPHQAEDFSLLLQIQRAQRSLEDRGVEAAQVDLLGQAMTDEHAARQAHGQRTAAQKVGVSLADLLRRRAVHFLQSQAKHQIQHLFRFEDWIVGQLGQLVVRQQEMNPLRVGRLELGDVFEHAVRHVAIVGRIGGTAVAHFLQDQVAPRMMLEVGDPLDGVEVLAIAVQIGRDHHVVADFRRQHDHIPFARRRIQVGFCRLLVSGDHAFDVVDTGNH